MRQLGDHAIVLGAGVAGLLAARVLTDFYEQVSIVERDPVPPATTARRGVPQGRHAHVMMPRGTQLLDDLFPNLVWEMVSDGAVLAEPLADFRFNVGGHLLRPAPIGAAAVQASRPFLESHLCERIRRSGRVEIVDGCDVVGLATDDTGTRVTGVRIMRRAPGSTEESLDGDLVVDALGRGGRTPAWLEALGYSRPDEDAPRVDVGYATMPVRLPASAAAIERTVGVGPVPGRPSGMILVEVESGTRMLTVMGLGADHRPPADPVELLDFVADFAPDDVVTALRSAERLGTVATYRYPSYLRRRYETMRRFPDGLLVIGDALCSFSPIYAQGMTVAAQEAVALQACLGRGTHDLARRYFRAAARIVADPWRTAVSADLALPEVDGDRPLSVRLLNRYVDRVLTAAENNDVVARKFMRVTGLLDSPATLFAPGIAARVLVGGRPEPARTRAPVRIAVAQARDVYKRYGRDDATVTALDGITSNFPVGRLTAIMGPSGSGKSTLLHCLSGLDSVTSGQVVLAGHDLGTLSDTELSILRRREIGFVFQAFNLLPTLSAEENITLPLDLAREPVDRDWLDTLITTVGLSDRLRHRPGELSGGQQQRVAVARALVSRPAVVFADEPTGNLDSHSSGEVLTLLRRAVDDLGQSVIMVTHDPTAASYADSVVYLADGRVADTMTAPTAERVLDRMKSLGGAS